MRTRRNNNFTTVRVEGAILPADVLKRVADGDAALGGLDENSYHLTSGEKVNEAISASWNRLLGSWTNYRGVVTKLVDGAAATTETRDRWLLPLFQELGYGRLIASRKSVEIQGKSYPISHFWNNVPIHLVGSGISIDRAQARIPGAARTSPHGLVQEFLNRTEDQLWGFVSNGKRLRILRDNSDLVRQSFVEFDLESMMDGEVYSDFVLLWLLCHQSRVEAERPTDVWLEKWSHAAQEQGVRALDSLRKGVEEAITSLGKGFIAHRANRALRERLRSGGLDKQDYYRQLLRLVYRLLFLIVAEDRGVLVDPSSDEKARERYSKYYSTAKLRHLAGRRYGSRHSDLYVSLRLVMQKLGSDEGCPELGLPALGSFLFSESALPDLEACEIANHGLLNAIRALAFTDDKGVRRSVDYKNLGSEELGSVYESLLELHPELNVDAAAFSLSTTSGHERKTSGSYYTPTSLINSLLDSALDPVLNEAGEQKDPEAALLNLKICDPACGSGHFLIAAAHRIAKRLAQVRTGDAEPSPEAARHSLRDVVGRCIYGVDINPMAVELCKVSLWMEAVEPGKPLSFLDHHILCGNSLLGATPALIKEGIPDEALKPIEGDDPEYCREYKRRNRDERQGQRYLPDVQHEAWRQLGNLATGLMSIDEIADDTIEGVRRRQERYERLVNSCDYRYGGLLADAWCAAFAWKKRKSDELPYPITEEEFRRIEENPFNVPKWMEDEIKRLAAQYQFFHWHLAFPGVFHVPSTSETALSEQPGWSGGFDAVLGNPPWDTLSPDAKEFFAPYDPAIRVQDSAGQAAIIEKLLAAPTISVRWNDYCRQLYTKVHLIKNSGVYRLFAPGNLGKGDFNVYRMFVEMGLQIVRSQGRIAQIVPEGFYNGANCMAIRKELFEENTLFRILGFENAGGTWFAGIHNSQKFCMYSALKGGHTDSLKVAFSIRSTQELNSAMSDAALLMPIKLVQEFSPEALALMEFSNQLEINIAQKMYALCPKFGDDQAGKPHREYMAEVHMGNDRELFDDDPSGLPLYEGRMVFQFDHRAKGYRSGRGRSAVWEDLPFDSVNKSIQPQWYIPEDRIPGKTAGRVKSYRIGFCDVASPTNERTLVASLIPRGCLCGHTLPTITFEPGFEWAYMVWLAVANSFAMDFLARQKVSLHMSYTILDSLPFPRLAFKDFRVRRIVPLALKLTCTSPEMTDYWNAMAKYGWVDFIDTDTTPPGLKDNLARLEAQAELDAIVAHDIFELTREELEYILGTFPIVERRNIEKYREYRTKEAILSYYDKLRAIPAEV